MKNYSIRTTRVNARSGKFYDQEVGKISLHDDGRLYLSLYMFPETLFKCVKEVKHDEFNQVIEE